MGMSFVTGRWILEFFFLWNVLFERCSLRERFTVKLKKKSRDPCFCLVIFVLFSLLASTLKDDQKSRIEKNLIKVLMVSDRILLPF